MRDRLRDYGADVEQSGSGVRVGDQWVMLSYGVSEGGDWLRFLVILATPLAWSVEQQSADTRYDSNSGGLPRLRHPDGVMRPVKTDGRVYLVVGDELRTMRVEMNMHDADGLTPATSVEGMWEYLEQFRVPEE
jgi:hypothetical protein